MKKFLVVCILLSSTAGIAQKMSITGLVADSTGSPLPSATVMLLSASDSSLVNFGASNAQGVFELKNLSPAHYMLKVTFVGYKTHSENIQPLALGGVIDLGVLKLH